MQSIESSGFPLVFQVPSGATAIPQTEQLNALNVRAYVRAFGGMQKEAIVALSTGETWRMVSDEGPYLNGTDLAPFPLGHFQVGMQFSLMAEILKQANEAGITLTRLEFAQVNGYSMAGSALRGTMTGGAMPVEVQITVEAATEAATETDAESIGRIIRQAEQRSPAHAIMRDLLENTFALRYNNQVLDLPDLLPSSVASPDSSDLASMYEKIQPPRCGRWRIEQLARIPETPTPCERHSSLARRDHDGSNNPSGEAYWQPFPLSVRCRR